MNNKKLQVWYPLLFALVMIVGMWLGYKLRDDTGGPSGFMQNSSGSSLQEVLNLVQNKYVDKVSVDSLREDAINEMLKHLDPHTLYIPAKELGDINEDMQGNFQGIGVEFQIFDDTVNIVNVIADGPSAKAGLKVGDKLIKINDTVPVASVKITSDKIKSLLRGAGGSTVDVSVLRNNALQKFTITRGTIPIPSVDAAYIVAPGTGFMHINKFSETTYPEFMQSLEKLQKQGMQKLILDLRGNPGGIVEDATEIADEFLDGDKMIVYTKGEHVSPEEYRSKRDGLFEKGKLAVLVDETSASASEILTGALQDWDRATIIGRRTFGKGLVQQQFNLTDGGALRLTVARYFTPLGRNIQKPYDNNNRAAYEDELMNRFHDGEVVHGDTAKQTGTSFKTPGGHIVYGGGGITPDIFIPFDTTAESTQVLHLYYTGAMNNFIYRYYMDNENYFSAFKSPADLYKQFKPGEKEWQALTEFAKKDTIDITTISPKAKADLLNRMQSLMAEQIWRTEGFYEVNNASDKMVEKALEVLR